MLIVEEGGGYQRHLNDQRTRVRVTERGANIAVWNGRESASVFLRQHNTGDLRFGEEYPLKSLTNILYDFKMFKFKSC